MRCHAGPLTWACIGWLFLGLLQLADCAAVDNKLAHARERIWLWEMYDLFTDIEGADKQDVILPQNQKAKWAHRKHFSLVNTVDGKLTYAEFMADLEKKLTPDGVDKSLVAPNGEGLGNPTTEKAVDALKSKGWAMPMAVDQVTSGRSNDYAELMGRVDKKFQAYYTDLGNDNTWKRRLVETNMRTEKLSKEIVSLRKQEADEWLLKQMTREVDPAGTPNDKKRYGLGLNRNELVVEKVTSTVPGATTYERVDLVQTFLDHPDRAAFERKLKAAGINNGIQGLVNWADNLGNQKFASWGPGYSQMNESHDMAKTVWTTVHKNASDRLGGIKPPSCSR
ncbi:hypothetical protein FLAG1_09323 [Fusarium langsethiae]|uniref:Uncharacterized protein n=1 Tax=Fusarium langsethiae TaxID=179993 RepID=A0A0M9EQJ6_FUSLA|nr:hypothetical protein FLAG1_09323 [Fusarium langsethiae]GKU06117.1 unnamed protein product [Fusarium langsethiae]GKU21496.1 unnamed protein product [Fusarium langsethiae]